MKRAKLAIEREKYKVLLGSVGVAQFDRRPAGSAFKEKLRGFYNEVKSIYPDRDNRRDIVDAPPEAQELARSVALICDSSELTEKRAGAWKLRTSRIGLYQTELFQEQEAVYNGFTGFLVGKDLLLTTAHGLDVDKLRVIFGFQLDRHGQAKTEFSEDEIFTVRPEGREYGDIDGVDWLLLRLDRSPARPHRAVEADPAPLGTLLWMFGHPLGLPLKFVDGAKILEQNGKVFECDLDASDGTSGAMVLKAGSNRVIGVLKEASAALAPKDEDDPDGPQIWLWCPKGENCSTSVTSSATFSSAVTRELANGNRGTNARRARGPELHGERVDEGSTLLQAGRS